jgi:hypothetical protein
MTASPSKTPAIKLRRRSTLRTSFRRKTGRACDACRLIHTREHSATTMWVQPRTAASFSETTPASTRRDSTHLTSDLHVTPLYPVTTAYVIRP